VWKDLFLFALCETCTKGFESSPVLAGLGMYSSEALGLVFPLNGGLGKQIQRGRGVNLSLANRLTFYLCIHLFIEENRV